MRSCIFGLAILIALAQPLYADKAAGGKIPKKLQGSWIVDADASAKNIKNNPKLKPEDEKMLPVMMGMLSKMCLKITEDKFISSMDSRDDQVDAVLVSEKNGEYHIKLQPEEGKPTELKVVFTKEGKLSLSDGKDGMMDYVIWKKGTVSESDKNTDVIGEVLKEAIKGALKEGLSSGKGKQHVKNNTKKPAAESDADYKLKFNRVEIFRLSEKTIDEINAIEKKPSRIQIQNECTQEDFDKISAFPWVKEIVFKGSNENINSIDVVAKLTDLKKITLLILKTSKEKPVDLTPLSGLSKLEWVSCMGTRVKNIQALSKLTMLKRAELHTSAVDSIDFVKNNPNLEHLGLYGVKHTFKNYEPVAGLKKLKSLNIYMNKQATDELLAPLAKITTLERIYMSNCKPVTSLEFLENCKNIKEVRAMWCNKLSDISSLADKSKLERFEIDDAIVKDFSVLKGKPNLKILNLADTSFSDLSLLKDSTELIDLDIEGTPIKDIAMLKVFKKLRRLIVSKDVSQGQIDMLKKENPKLRIRTR